MMGGDGYDVNIGPLYNVSSALMQEGRGVTAAGEGFDTTLPSTAFGVFGTPFALLGSSLLQAARIDGVTTGDALEALGYAVAATADDLNETEEQATTSQNTNLDQMLGGDE